MRFPSVCAAIVMAAMGCNPASGFILGAPIVSVASDAGPVGDLGSTADSSPTTDLGPTTDAGPIADSGPQMPNDAGNGSMDSGGLDASDAATSIDTGEGTDLGPLPDVPFIPVDAPAPGVALPAFTPAVLSRIAALRATGIAMGNQGDVFAKIGDSITESGSFLFDCGMGYGTLASYSSLQATITFFSSMSWPDPDPTAGITNSFDRHSLCAMGGWDSTQAITPYMGESSPRLVQEILAIHPAWALVEYGTNDLLEAGDLWGTGAPHPEATFQANMMTIVSMIEAHGVVPILYTIPPLLPIAVTGDTDPSAVQAAVQIINNVIRSIAVSDSIPLIDFWVALTALPSPYGILPPDGIHPSAYNNDDACNFTTPALTSGYNIRNLLTLQMLARLQTM